MATANPPRRKGPKNLPKLPLSAFSPPNSGISEHFPLPPSPSTVHPDHVVDASVRVPLAQWKKEWAAGGGAGQDRAKAVVVFAPEGNVDRCAPLSFAVCPPRIRLIRRLAIYHCGDK